MPSQLSRVAARRNNFDRVVNRKPFRANSAFDKAAILLGVTAIGATVGWWANLPIVVPPWKRMLAVPPRRILLFVSAAVAIGLAVFGTLRPRTAKWAGPMYAFVQGFVLGGIAMDLSIAAPVVAVAFIMTSALFVGTLFVVRTGARKVAPRLSLAGIVAFAFFALFTAVRSGLELPDGPRVILRVALYSAAIAAVGVAYLFEELGRVEALEQSEQTSDSLQWYVAFVLTLDLVLFHWNGLIYVTSARRSRNRRKAKR